MFGGNPLPDYLLPQNPFKHPLWQPTLQKRDNALI